MVLVLLAVPLRPVLAQDVFIRPDPRHPAHASIHLASLDMDLQVRAGVAAVTLTQVFRNPNPWQAEGIYLFPLPEGATVTGFRLTMDGEPVSGEVLDRRKAREIYLDIVRRIRDPALLEWVNNRAFQARIFPFPANGERTLELSYSVVFPLEGDYQVFNYPSGRCWQRSVFDPPQRLSFDPPPAG